METFPTLILSVVSTPFTVYIRDHYADFNTFFFSAKMLQDKMWCQVLFKIAGCSKASVTWVDTVQQSLLEHVGLTELGGRLPPDSYFYPLLLFKMFFAIPPLKLTDLYHRVSVETPGSLNESPQSCVQSWWGIFAAHWRHFTADIPPFDANLYERTPLTARRLPVSTGSGLHRRCAGL